MTPATDEQQRCPGCGSVVNGRACNPVSVDTTKPGFRYLADTWGYCLTEGRHVGANETPWLVARETAARADERERTLNTAAAWALLAEWNAANLTPPGHEGEPAADRSYRRGFYDAVSVARSELREALVAPESGRITVLTEAMNRILDNRDEDEDGHEVTQGMVHAAALVALMIEQSKPRNTPGVTEETDRG